MTQRQEHTLPTRVSVECPAKTNLTLRVGERHKAWQGRHELDTLYCAIDVCDIITTERKHDGSGFSVELTGAHLGDLASSDADLRQNHAVLALFAMAQAAGHEPDVRLHIEKHIPVGAGLGGGSSDAAGVILALNELWGLHWELPKLQHIAAALGSDMPFCLTGGYAHGGGYGEAVTLLEETDDTVRRLRDEGWHGGLLVGAYQAELRTPEVYAMFDDIGGAPHDVNDLQRAAITLHPRSGDAIENALQAGATHALVSGSGPSVIAFTPTPDIARCVRESWQRHAAVDWIIAAQAPARPRISRTYA